MIKRIALPSRYVKCHTLVFSSTALFLRRAIAALPLLRRSYLWLGSIREEKERSRGTISPTSTVKLFASNTTICGEYINKRIKE